MASVVSDQTLEAAYRHTRYRVLLPHGGALDVRPGRRCPDLDRLLATLACREWAFISAWNPGSRLLPSWRNAARSRRLARALTCRGHRFLPGLGVPEQGLWKPEVSLLVLGTPVAPALRIGRQFGQHAILAGRRAGVAELFWCRPRAGRLTA